MCGGDVYEGYNDQPYYRCIFRDSFIWRRKDFKKRNFDGIVFFSNGENEYRFQDKTIVAKKGDILFLPGNLPYRGIAHTNMSSYYVINFLCTSEDAFELLDAPCVYTPRDFETMRVRFENILGVWKRQQIDVGLKVKSFLYSILCETISEHRMTAPRQLTDSILQYIVDHTGDPLLTVNDLCSRFSISASQLRRNIYKATGLTPNEYILQLRLNKAKYELACTKKTIKQIAFDCGFASQYYFSRCFSKSLTISPTDYRRYYHEE